MKRKFKIPFTLCLLLTAFSASRAQYFGEQVMEKSFEQTDFFFTPYTLVPFGIGTFRNSVAGVLDDPLINLGVNPSYLYRDSVQSGYVYVDFRSARDVFDRSSFYHPYPVLASRAIESSYFLPYPRFYVNTRRELEPVLSTAFLFHPTEGALSNLSLGVTYQMISQDDKYYAIPQDIYKSVLGSDYLGVRSAAAENIPIVDKFSGSDNIHQNGHFVSLFAGYEFDPSLKVGVKFGRVTFDRDGSYGSQNLWENYYSSNSTSLWRNVEARKQLYRHWEIIGGANYPLNEKYNLGITAGYLWGDADQVLMRGDSSYYSYGLIGSTTGNWNSYSRGGNQRQTWKHEGKTHLAGINFKAQATPTQLWQFHYLYTRQNTDIALAGLVLDASFGRSRYEYDTSVTNHVSNSRLFDQRSGSGTRVGSTHRAVGSLQWQIKPSVKLSIGLQFERQSIETKTSEAILANRFSRYSSTGRYPYSHFDSTAEAKTLEWDFRTKLFRFSMPIFLTVKTSDVVELLFGLNRSASEWEVDDVTLAIFDYRVRSNQQGTTRSERFGERYTQPQENVSDVRTTFLAGLTVAPSRVFSVRLLVVPNFTDTYEGQELSDLQWWIGVNLLP